MSKKPFHMEVPAASLDLSSGLGYGLIYQPVLAYVNTSVNPLIVRPSRNSFRKFYVRLDKSRKP
jgi:hypothetical protein